MKIIIPMAGKGTRLRPHTLTIPKPLIKIAGKSIVQRLVEDLSGTYGDAVEEIAFITGDFGIEIESQLIALANQLGAVGKVYHQVEQLGTAHAVLCAAESLQGEVIVAFADTLFESSFHLDTTQDGVIWVQKVENPSAYGVVKLDSEGHITDFIEKPKTFVSDLAIIGIYFFRSGENLRRELQYLVDNNIHVKGEFQLTDALENMKNKGVKFATGEIREWLDCGNKNAVVFANQRILERNKDQNLVHPTAKIENSTIISPCYIGENAVIENTVIGPHVSVGSQSVIQKSVISNSIIQEKSNINHCIMENSMIGNMVEVNHPANEYSIGDYVVLNG